MDGDASLMLESSEASSELKTESQASKKRKMVEKTVVKVRIGENVIKLKNEGLPSDFWSWRKYGQKPIKGSPYPRGYYRCSTCKGCSAKKQVEKCRTDASMLIITYTSSHNHPSPDVGPTTNLAQQPKEFEIQTTEFVSASSATSKEEYQEEKHKSNITSDQDTKEENFHPTYCSEDISDQDEISKLNTEKIHHDKADLLPLEEEEDPLCYSQLKNFTPPKSEELDFFDELEELPMSSSFLDITRSNFFDESIPVAPS